jgi:cation diffusion facilitator CzcD-associated flavoprotein CzcO
MNQVLIIGAGFAGLGTAIRLRQAGIEDIVILERGADVGGTWRDNTYPGAACDVPSLLYSFSFAPNPDWTRAYSGSAEILAYTHHLVDRFGLRPLIRFGTDVTAVDWDDEAGLWTVTAADGSEHRARSVVMAAGPLANASFPDIPGIDDFTGHKILSSRWDHDCDLTGKRVAVIGTGASAVQIVPELVKRAASVKVFQRTPGWVMPKPDPPHPAWLRGLFRQVPAVQRAGREALYWTHELMALGLVWNTAATTALQAVGQAHLRLAVRDPWLRRRLTPEHRIGCKRVLMTNDYLPALQRDNCTLVTWPIYAISANGVRTAEGIEHEVDAIVFATGFDVSRTGTPFPVTGRDGRTLDKDWVGGARAYKSVTVAGYPNLFLTFGPNSGPGHNSALVYNEAQIDHIVRAVRLIRDRGLRSLEVREDVQERHNADLQRRLGATTWNSGCRSWYLTEDGYNATMYPGFATRFARELAVLAEDDYDLDTALGADITRVGGRSPMAPTGTTPPPG